MDDLKTLLITILGVILFVAIFPYLVWLFIIIGIIILIAVIYIRHKYHQALKDANQNFNSTNEENYDDPLRHSDNGLGDIIDAEYSEREESDD